MYFWISMLVVALFCGQTSAVVDKRFPTNRNGDKMTNVVEKDGFLFVSENGILHQLDLALTFIKSFNTCGSESCVNVNKVLTVSDDLLVLCGTGNNGVCQALNGSKVVYSSSSVYSHSNYLTVSTNIDAPAVGIAFEGDFYLGRGMTNEDGTNYRNYITRNRIDNNFESIGSAHIFGEHPVYFKTVFQHNRTISFLTNQRYNLISTKPVSKLIHINADEPCDINRNVSFTETVLICQADGDDYSLLQDGAYLPAKGVLVAAFSQGDDPENSLSNSAVCVYDIGALSSPISILKLNNTKITKVKGRDRYGLYPDVFVGTETGSVIKLSVDDSLQVHIYETNSVIDRGHPITDIHIGEEKGYVVTNRKISSFKKTECSFFKTCKEIMAVRNPACGWCLRNSTGTKMSDCYGGWISSLSKCISIDVSPKYIAVSEVWPRGSEITISVSNIPEGFTTGMKCRYFRNNQQVGAFINANQIGVDKFTCEFLIISDSTGNFEQRVQLVAFNTTELFTYAETTIQVYECDNYTTCGNCLQSTDIKCQWCRTSLTCQSNSSSCEGKTINRNTCPRLHESEIFLPNGITNEVSLNVTNMISAVNYTCVIEQNGTRVEIPAMVNNGRVKVPLIVSFDEDEAKMNIPLSLFQVNGQTTSKVENTIYVTVYKCERLGTDCTKCGALKPNRYDCKWCESGQCVHSSRCSQNISCPLPQITKVYPPSGGYKGGTQLRITGTNFGTSSNRISDIKVGDLPCSRINVPQDVDFDFDLVNTEIQCVLVRGGDEEGVGTKNVTFEFDGIRCGYGGSSLLNPVVTKIEPSFGPAIGGTLITLSGTDLDIEGSIPLVRLGHVALCFNVIRHSNRLTCITPTAVNALNVSYFRLIWNSEFYTSYVTFHFLKTPSITEVSTKRSILSGGTVLHAVGIHLKNAANAVIVADYAGVKEVAECIASLETSLECPFPQAPRTAVEEMMENTQGNRERRSLIDSSIRIDISIQMDGYVKTFEVDYYRDPVVEPFRETIMIPYLGKKRLTIEGNYLDLGGGLDDYKVLISDGNCLVIDVARSNITCIPPDGNPDKTAETLKVEVQLGNFKQTVGYVRYEANGGSAVADNTLGIVMSGVGVVLFIAIIVGIVLFCYKYRRVKARIPKIKMRKRKESNELNEMATSRPQTRLVVDNHSNAHNIVERSDYMDLDENRGRQVYQDLDHQGNDDLDVSVYQEIDQIQDHDNHVYTELG